MYNTEAFRPVCFHGGGKMMLHGTEINYTSISEDNVFYDETGKPLASIFSFSYFRSDDGKGENRPVLFIFNGGPGASSVLVHAGCFGPRRIEYPQDIRDYTNLPPYKVIDNPDCLLDIADLVMVDPISTGYGLLLDEDSKDRFFGIDEDAQALVMFVSRWLTRYKRWNSPKYLVGESYGCVRAATAAGVGVSGGPQIAHNVTFDGLIFIGNTVTTARYFNKGIPVEPAVEALPTMAAINWYHNHPSEQSLEEFVLESSEFAADEYISALFKGNSLDPEKREEIKKKLMYYSGVSEGYLESRDLKLERHSFLSELLKERKEKVSICDGRFTSPLFEPAIVNSNPAYNFDPASIRYSPYVKGALLGDISEMLGMSDFERYYVPSISLGTELTRPEASQWDFDSDQCISGDRLAIAMHHTPGMRILFTNGWYDLVTQTGLIWHTLNQLHLPMDRVYFKGIPAGHMAYFGEDNCKLLQETIHHFLLKEEL